MVRVPNAAPTGPLSQSGGSEGQNTCACAHAEPVSGRGRWRPATGTGRAHVRLSRSRPATLAAVTDAAAPRAADPDGPLPGQRAGGAEPAGPPAADGLPATGDSHAPDERSAADADLATALAAVAFADERLAALDASIRAMAGVLA